MPLIPATLRQEVVGRALTTLFNPRAQRWSDHFALAEGQVVGLTPIGRATASLLRFNDPIRVDNRRALIAKERYPLQPIA